MNWHSELFFGWQFDLKSSLSEFFSIIDAYLNNYILEIRIWVIFHPKYVFEWLFDNEPNTSDFSTKNGVWVTFHPKYMFDFILEIRAQVIFRSKYVFEWLHDRKSFLNYFSTMNRVWVTFCLKTSLSDFILKTCSSESLGTTSCPKFELKCFHSKNIFGLTSCP